MLNMKNKLAKRIMAFVLSGAMVISGLAPTGMTAYAAEASDDTGSGYSREVDTTVADEVSQGEENDEEAAFDETVQVVNTEETEAETAVELQTQTSETESSLRTVSEEETVAQSQTSEVKSSLHAEDMEEEVDDKNVQATAPSADSTVWTAYPSDAEKIFKGSFFGNNIGTDNGQAVIKADADGSMYLEDKGKAKPGGSNDGFVMYYYQVPKGTKFTLTARARIEFIKTDSTQSAFGLIARDDMYVDQVVTGLNSSWIGACMNGQVAKAGYKRVQGEQLYTGLFDFNAPAATGDVYDLGISYDGTKYTIQINDIQYEEESLDLFASDTDNLYIGMIATRSTKVKYDRIYLATGDNNSNVIMDQRADVSGTISGRTTELETGTTIHFTDADGTVTEGEITKEGDTYKYSAKLYAGEYTVALSDTSYTVSNGSPVTVANKAATKLDNVTADITVKGIQRVQVSGAITGASFDDLKLIFLCEKSGDKVEVRVNSANTWSAMLAVNSAYALTADATGIKDYTINMENITVAEQALTEQNIEFTEKTKHKITLQKSIEGLYKDSLDLRDVKIIFSNKTDEGYETKRGIDEEVQLRDGSYAVSLEIPVKIKVANNNDPEGNGIAEYPVSIELNDLNVSGEASYPLAFEERMVWDFAAEDPLLPIGDIQASEDYFYNGLLVKTKSVSTVGKFGVQGPSNNRVQINDGTEVLIPVAGSGTVAIKTSSTNGDKYTIDGVAASTVQAGTEGARTFSYEDKPIGSYMVLKSTAGIEDGKTLSVYLEKIAITRTKEPEGGNVPAKKHTIWLVGDSTVCTYINPDGTHKDKDRYYQRWGYGTMLDKYLDDNYKVNNIALSGRSSKSFLSESVYSTLIGASGIREGDILIIGFGHNDEKRNSTHYTNPNGDYQTEGSFAKSLYDNYVKIALDKGAQPILCTPIVHLREDNNYANEHITSDGQGTDSAGNTITYKGGDYPKAIRDLGTAVNVPVVDLTQLTGEKWAELGYDEAFFLHASDGSDPKVPDTTHVNSYGAKMIAHILATQISGLENLELAQHITNLDNVATKDDLDLSINDPNKGDYKPPTTASKYGEDFGIFKATAFGSLNAEAPAGTIALGKDANGNMNIKVTGDNGKISAKNDGIAMYYYQIPSNAKFNFSAKATINAIGDDEEAAFGLMARDDMYIDKVDENILSNYVAAGTFAKNSVNCFYRNGKELKPGAAITAVKAGDTYDLNISTTQDGYTCKFGDNELQANGYDFGLSGIDSAYKYIGMFVSKNADVTFSDIKIIVNDKEVEIDNGLMQESEGRVTLSETDGLLAGKVYGVKDVATFEVFTDMPFNNENTVTVGNETYPGYFQGPSNTEPSDNSIPTAGQSAFKITARKDSKITFVVNKFPNKLKNFYFFDAVAAGDKPQTVTQDMQDPAGSSDSFTFDMKAGHTYYFYAAGSKVMVAAVFIKSRVEGDSWWFEGSEEKPSEPGTGEEKPSEPGTGEEKPSEPGTGEEKPSDPGTGEEEPDTPSTKIPADDKINTISISGSRIKIEAANLIVNPKKAQYNVTVTYTYTDKAGIKRQQQLTEGLHYKVSFVGASTGKEVGEQKINITGTNVVTDLGKFVNTKTVSYQLMDKKAVEKTKDITKVKAIALDKNVIKNLTYTGNYITPDVLGIDSLDAASYKIVYKNNVNAGKASVTVIGQGEYYGSKVLPYTIKPTDLSKPTAEDGLKLSASNVKEFTGSGKAYSVAEAFAYKGSPVTLQNLTLTYAGKKLRAQEDYTIAYKINVQKGTGTATIKGINNFKGSIKIDYTMEIASDIATLLGTLNTPENAVPAEFSSKGARLTEIKLSNGVTLKENADYKVKYGKECKTVTVGQKDLTVTITGAGAYKNTIAKDTPIAIEVVKGKYHIKDGTIVDAKKATDDAKLLSAAKVTDASGAKVKNVTLAQREADKPVSFITVIPSDTENYEQTTLPCRVATKLGSVKEVAKIPNQAFDGVNSVTVTKKNIEDTLGIDGKYFRIVSYKNNHKLGGATVTVEGIGLYYGTKNLKFKIVLDKIDPNKAETGATEDTSVIEDPSVEESSGTTESGDTTESSGTTESGDTTESSGTEESSDTGGSEPDKPTPSGKRIDVWDFGAKQEADTKIYNNHIKASDWDNCELLNAGVFPDTSQKINFGDVTIATGKADRLFAPDSKKTNTGSIPKIGTTEYSDKYKANGGWYCNGARDASNGYIEIANVSAGDRIDAYLGPHNGTNILFVYEGGEPKVSGELGNTTGAVKMSFAAENNGTYKIYSFTKENSGKPFYCRVQRIPAADVSGTIDFGPLTATENVKLKFVNDTTKAETIAAIEGTAFKVKLAAGYTYTANLSGATGYGFTNETKKITITNDDALAGKDSVKLAVETKETYVYSGNITGFAEGYDISKLAITMKADPDSQSDDASLVIKEDLSFTVTLDPDVTYTIVMEGVNDYEVTSESTINKNVAYTADITVALKSMFTASGKFVDLDGKTIDGLNVTKLVLKNVEDEYEYEAAIADGGYTISLRDGAYSAVATVEGYTTSTHVVVEGKDAEKNLLFVSTVADGDLERVADLYVDKNDSSKYQTVNEAVKAAKRMKPASETERITIHIAPGVYREQIIVQAPYVTFVNDDPSQGEVKLTWYQGIGYQYYSVKDGFYNAESAYDKFEKGEAKNWGAAVQIKATGFLAKNIVFEHSLNRYITDEEIEDGVEPTATGGKPARTYSLDVNSKNATERGAALYLDTGADNAEFYQCKFLSSQDTIGTGKKGTHGYFKECFIEGGTDYICSEGSVVFDNCVLNFKGYSDDKDKKMGGYITAAKTGKNEQDPASEDLGYLFWNCTITGSKELPVAPGYYGRPWDQNAKVAFVNTKLERADIILPAGWTSMSGATPEKANFKEYNTTSLDGGIVDTSNRTEGTVVSTNPVPNVEAFKAYFGNWTPKYYTAEDADVAFTTDPYLENNADLNSPHPGNTLSVKYSLGENNDKNDASIIKWYRVDDAGNETLVKASTAIAGKSYKVQTADEGNFIKAEVTPTVASGNAGTAKSIQTGQKIQAGWEEPGVGDAVLGEGVNVFLAGDSTVKDYSAQGMYNGGKAQDLSSWGEYLQSFFNKEKVTIVNYANGGRSSRTFINDGYLDKIKQNMSSGDYLFIQFGHNDCSAGYADRFVPIGEPNEQGIYPTNTGTKGSDDKYSYNSGGTFKWFLKQYVEAAREKGAVPVLVTPVARMYYDKQGNGTIRTHHDCAADTATDNTYTSSNNAYVEAVKQLAEEENVLLIDAYEFTKGMYEMAWTDSTEKAGDMCNYGSQLMGVKDGTVVDATHCNKLGGFIEAAYMTKAIKNLQDATGNNLNIASAITAPKAVSGEMAPKKVDGVTVPGKTVFTVNNSGKFTAYDKLTDYGSEAEYWTQKGTELITGLFLQGN